MSATNGRVEATDILSPRDARLGAADAAFRANHCMREAAWEAARVDTEPQRLMEQAARYALVALALQGHVDMVGKWVAR